MNVLAFQVPDAVLSREINDPQVQETWCGAGTNGTDWVAAALGQEGATVSEVSESTSLASIGSHNEEPIEDSVEFSVAGTQENIAADCKNKDLERSI